MCEEAGAAFGRLQAAIQFGLEYVDIAMDSVDYDRPRDRGTVVAGHGREVAVAPIDKGRFRESFAV